MRQHAKILHGAGFAIRTSGWLFAGILGLTTLAAAVQAGEVYKSVDANGTVVYSDHVDPSLSGTTTIQLDDSHLPPHELHFCWTNCFTLVLDQGVYHRADGTDETWTVETFSAQAMVLHRHDAPADWNGHSQDVVYAGQIANDRLVGVSVDGRPTSGVDASWGSALNTLPGSNAERDAPNTGNPNASSSSVVKSDTTPPPLPEEDQPTLVQDGYLWTPGYWYWRDLRYVWIPGAWARPPQVSFLWTPAYWGRAGTVYVFHPGRWGSTVGFYGGMNYGFGYIGNGYNGGHWIGDSFAYNTAVNHVDPAVAHRTYSEAVLNQGLRGAPSYASPTHAGGGTQAMSQHQAAARAVAMPATTAIAPRTREAAPMPVAVDNPARAAKPSPAGTPAKLNHITPTHAAPLKQ
jgi:Domain of unknown function (DUF4124)/WXXGXW repeat (2 copies)